MKNVNKQKEQDFSCVQNTISTTGREKRTQKKLLSLKESKTLLSYLVEEKELTEQEAKTLKKYRHLHFKSKRDIGAPRQTGSQMDWFEQGFRGMRQASPPPYQMKRLKKKPRTCKGSGECVASFLCSIKRRSFLLRPFLSILTMPSIPLRRVLKKSKQPA